MGKRSMPERVQVGGLETGDVEIVRTKTGEAFFRPHVRPRAWDRLGPEGQAVLSGLQHIAGEMSQLQAHVELHVQDARELGASWDVIGWSLGVTGEGARQRYGDTVTDE